MKSICLFLAAMCLLAMVYWPYQQETPKETATSTEMQRDATVVVEKDGDYNIVLAWAAQQSYDMQQLTYLADGTSPFIPSGYSNSGDEPFRFYPKRIRTAEASIMLFPFGIFMLLFTYRYWNPKKEEALTPVPSLADNVPSTAKKFYWSVFALGSLACVCFGIWSIFNWSYIGPTWFTITGALTCVLGAAFSVLVFIGSYTSIWDIATGDGSTNDNSEGIGLSYFVFTTTMNSIR